MFYYCFYAYFRLDKSNLGYGSPRWVRKEVMLGPCRVRNPTGARNREISKLVNLISRNSSTVETVTYSYIDRAIIMKISIITKSIWSYQPTCCKKEYLANPRILNEHSKLTGSSNPELKHMLRIMMTEILISFLYKQSGRNYYYALGAQITPPPLFFFISCFYAYFRLN